MDSQGDVRDEFTWECPACDEKIEASGPDGLTWNVRQHILHHETRAGLKAVEQAKENCTRTYCGLNTLSPDEKITVHDRKYLGEMKIGW